LKLVQTLMSSQTFKVVNGFIDGVSSSFVCVDAGNEEDKIGPYLSSLQRLPQYLDPLLYDQRKLTFSLLRGRQSVL
jgi:hypothetical protein